MLAVGKSTVETIAVDPAAAGSSPVAPILIVVVLVLVGILVACKWNKKEKWPEFKVLEENMMNTNIALDEDDGDMVANPLHGAPPGMSGPDAPSPFVISSS